MHTPAKTGPKTGGKGFSRNQRISKEAAARGPAASLGLGERLYFFFGM